MGKVLGVEFTQALAIVDSLADDEHGGEGEVIVVNDFGKIFQYATIDFLIWPREVIAGGYGSIFWILHQEFALHIVDDGCA